MSNYRGHVAGSATFAFIYLAFLSLVFAVEIVTDQRDIFRGYAFPIAITAIVVLFGLWPDVDINSKAQNLFYSIFLLIDVGLIISSQYQVAAYFGLLAMLPIIGKHRGWTHTFTAMLLIPLPILIVPYLDNMTNPWAGLPYYGAAVTGYFSHLFFDGLVRKKLKKLLK